MTSTAANATNDVSSEVSLFRTIVFAMAHTTAILTDLVFIVTKRSVQGSKLPQLITFMIVLTFGRRRGLYEKLRWAQ
jgi:hypothetical protein